jgi:subtilisin family serine protease
MDLRHADLNRLDLTESSPRLLDAFFDSETKWPDVLPAGFDPGEILDLNRNPGLGLRAVHAAGVTGTGVSVAVIDTPLLLDHDEYAGRLRYYGEVNARGVLANFHGCLVTSILAGKTCGVAPGAEVYYVGSHNYDIADESGAPNAKHYARAVDLLLEVNARLPREKRIRVISISAGCGPRNPGFKAMNRAIRKAAEAGIFVVSGNIIDSFGTGLWIWGFDRRSTEDPDDPSSGRVQAWKEWISQVAGGDRFDLYYAHKLKGTKPAEFLVLPEGSKTVAQAGGRAEYGFYPIGGWSSIFPYVAGLYALACQVKPDITPEVFWRIALATGDPVPVEGDGARYAGKRVNPARLIAALHAPN